MWEWSMGVERAFQHILPRFLTLDYPFVNILTFIISLTFSIFWERLHEIGLSDIKYDLNDLQNNSGDLDHGQDGILTNALLTDWQTNRPTDQQSGIKSRRTRLKIWCVGLKHECWESISTQSNAFPDLGLPFFECFDIFSFFGFFQFFEKDFKKLAWVTQNMTWMILRMTQVTSFMVKMTFKWMRYRLTNRPTDGPTEWGIESLHTTKNMMWGMKQECWESISTHFTAFPDLGLPFFECFDIFSFFGFFQFFERDFKAFSPSLRLVF